MRFKSPIHHKKASLFAWLILGLVSLRAQSVFIGKVVDAEGRSLSNIQIFEDGKKRIAATDSLGIFSFETDYTQTMHIFGYTGEERVFGYEIKPNETLYKNRTIVLRQGDGTELIPSVSITVNQVDNPFSTILKPRDLAANPTIGGGVEGLIKTLGGVSSNNELSNQFSVRGGNFDENLTYINDIEIYRPQLISSGQQEGLSVINPDLVDNLSFSAGGFNASYGDKMSSVLDVHYQQPDSQGAIINMGLLVNSVSLYGTKKRWKFLGGVRQYSNSLVGRSLDEQGIYTMNFADAQALITFKPSASHEFSFLGNTALNRYKLSPVSRSTDFGTIQTAIRLQVGFEGAEMMNYDYGMAALTYKYQYDKNKSFKFIAGITGTNETENFDIQGAYELQLLETNSGGSAGKPLRTLGFGYFIDHGRNRFQAQILQLAHLGELNSNNKKSQWKYGFRYYNQQYNDKYSEWLYNDSADYNIPPTSYATDSIFYDDFVDSRNRITSNKFEAYLQQKQVYGRNRNLISSIGLRANYWDLNNELFVTPRFNLTWEPYKKQFSRTDTTKPKHWVFKFAAGAYFQPAVYRELRDFQGQLNLNLKAQRSYHLLLGSDHLFRMWGRRFKWTSEAYYKKLDRLVPYLYDNIRIRYYAQNSARGFAWGVDNRVNGEFIEGVESWFTLSILQTKEQIDYTNSLGESVTSDFLRRPSDRRVNFAMVFQDELPNDPTSRVNLSFTVGSAVPYFLNREFRYTTTPFTLSPYRRLDIGFSKVLIGPEAKYKPKGFLKGIDKAWISLEVFNLANFQNTISYQWVKDLNNNVFGVPEYLTSRRLNLRLHLEI